MKKTMLDIIIHVKNVVATLNYLQEKEFENYKHNLILKEFL